MAITASTTNPLKGGKRWAYLARATTIRVATVNDDGSLYLTPLWFVVRDQRIFLPLDAGGRHGKNGTSGRPVSALVDSGDEFVTVAGVRILGRLEANSNETVHAELEALMFDKYFYEGHPYAHRYFEFGEFAGRVYYELVVDKLIGWDSRETTVSDTPERRSLPAHIGDRLV